VQHTFIGIDLGTSGCRACLIDDDKNLLQEARRAFPQPSIQGQRVEQDAAIWWQAVTSVLTELCQHPAAQSLVAISVDGTSSTVLVTDEHYQPLAAALMYNDGRATEQARLIDSVAPPEASAVRSASSGLSKLLWLLEQFPDSRKMCHQADYIAGKLSGHYVSDFNNGLKTGFDPESQNWPEWLSKLPIPAGMLPDVYAPGTLTGKLTAANKSRFGISNSVYIVAGTTDSIAGFLATGASDIGDAVTSLGSTIAIKLLSPVAINSPSEGIYSHSINNAWLAGGASNAGGSVLTALFDDATLQQLSQQLNFEQSTGLNYYPLTKTGERFPENDAGKAACLSPRPDSDVEFLQAILEALTAIEKKGYEVLAQKGAPLAKKIFTVGGGSKNIKWMQHRDKQLHGQVISAKHSEACYGSALLARQGFIKMNNKEQPSND